METFLRAEPRSRVGEETGTRRLLQYSLIAALVAAYGGVGFYFHAVLGTDIAYTHAAYVPIVLASTWWGRRGIFVAGLLAALVLCLRALEPRAGVLWGDVFRIAFFFVVSSCIGVLSDRVRAGQRALADSEQKHRRIVEKSLAGILVHRGTKILFANSRFCGMIGCSPGEMLRKSFWDLFWHEDRPAVQERVTGRMEDGVGDLHYECRLVRADGDVLWADVASSVMVYGGEPAALMNAYDITDRKEEERKRRELAEFARKQEEQLIHSSRLAEMGEMAAGVAHEMNQPLTGIRTFAKNALYMIEQGAGTTDEVRENLFHISEQVGRATRIINQMRLLSRKSERHHAPVEIGSVVREVVDFLAPQMKLAGVDVELDLPKDLPAVMGDHVRLGQVFLNLLNNAKQALGGAPVRRICVRTSLEQVKDRHLVTATVSDTGKGFAPEEAGRLFAPFYTTKAPGEGTGLGLSISLSIVEEHGGSLTAAGTPGRGAAFTVRLPASGPADGGSRR